MNRTATFGNQDIPIIEPPQLLETSPVDVGGTVYGIASDSPNIEISGINLPTRNPDISDMLTEEVLQNKIELEFQLKGKSIYKMHNKMIMTYRIFC